MGKGGIKFHFDINWKLTLFVVTLFPLLILLGFWQLSRAEEKEALLNTWNQQHALPAIEMRSTSQDIPNNRRVRIKGQFDAIQYWLLEGKVLNGRLGYHVVMAFMLDGSMERVLVNRGWVAANKYREILPEFTTPVGTVFISGTWSKPSDVALIEETGNSANSVWPVRILEANIQPMGEQYGVEFPTNIVRIDEDSAAALQVYWQPINIIPAKHLGYAVQWFAMAFALVVLWVFSNTNLRNFLIQKQ